MLSDGNGGNAGAAMAVNEESAYQISKSVYILSCGQILCFSN